MKAPTIGRIEIDIRQEGVTISETDAYLSGPMFPVKDWPKIRDFIDKELGVVHRGDKAQQNIEAILNGEEWAAAQRNGG